MPYVPVNGHKKSKLESLLDYHERVVLALKTTIELLNADATAGAQSRHSRTLRTAILIDSLRTSPTPEPEPAPAPAKRPGLNSKPKPKPTRGEYARKNKQQRSKTATMLATLDPTEPRSLSNPRSASVLLLHGFIRKKGSGYVRTSKEFRV
jgi:hypothetical protein